MFDDIEGLCVPALIYLIFGTTRVIIDTYKGLYNLAFMQIFITILFTYLLNVLCRGGLGIISWIIVAIPFILMSVIAVVLLGVFGLHPATGKALYSPQATSAQGQGTEQQDTQQQQSTSGKFTAVHSNPITVNVEPFTGVLGTPRFTYPSDS
jgi:bacteriorhodopsin